MKQNARKKTPNTGGRRFFWKSVFFMQKCQKIEGNFWRFGDVVPFSKRIQKKPKHSRAARKNTTTADCTSRHRSSRRRTSIKKESEKERKHIRRIKRHKQSEHNMNRLRKAETGEEEKEGDKKQEEIEGRRRRRGKKKKQGIPDLELEVSEMGCETQYEKEDQEEPGEIKGDTEKLRKYLFFGGGGWKTGVFNVFCLCTSTKLCPKKGQKTVTCEDETSNEEKQR